MAAVIAEQAAPAAQPRFNNLGIALKLASPEAMEAFSKALQAQFNPNGRKAAEIKNTLGSAPRDLRYAAVKHLKRLGVSNKTVEDAAKEHLNN